jgi:hypothetical protein
MRFARLVLAFVLTIPSLATEAAVFIVPPDDQMIAEAGAIVLGTVHSQFTAFAVNGDIVTHTRITPTRILKGSLSAPDRLEVRDLGGIVGSRAMGVSGGVTYGPGEEVLVFLTRDSEQYWTTYGFLLGKMRVSTDGEGNSILLRDIGPGVIGLNPDGLSEFIEQPRLLAAFLRYITRLVNDEPRAPRESRAQASYFLPGDSERDREKPFSSRDIVAESHFPPSAYTQGTFRWDVFDRGGSVTYYTSGSQPGYDSTGAAQRALAAWTNDPSSNVRLVYGGSRSAGFVEDGINAIVYNASSGVPAGAVGYAKWYANATHSYKGVTFYSISEGDVVMRAGLTVSAAAFDEAVTHETGHTLGFRHSDQGTPASNDAVMRSVVSGRFGASLGPWDRDAVSHVYTGTTCTPPSITAQPQSSTVTSGTSVTLTVGAGGTTPLSYQWYVGSSGITGSPISGATSSSVTVTPASTTNYWVRVSNACGAANSATATITVTNPPPPPGGAVRGDFNADGRPDLVWRNSSTGQNRVWFMNDSTFLGSAALTSAAAPWQIAGTGDFNGDGFNDLVWRNDSTAQTIVWFLRNTTYLSATNTLSAASDWTIISVPDIDENGDPDFLWRNKNTGTLVAWVMNGTTYIRGLNLPHPGLSYALVGTGDFNRDGSYDLVWEHVTNGSLYIWLMNGAAHIGSVRVGSTGGPPWKGVAVADFDRDGDSDIVFRNGSTGQNVMWRFNGTTFVDGVNFPTEANTAWRIVAPR